MKGFQKSMTDSMAIIDDKIKVLENLESELERGNKRIARDKTDYLLQMRTIYTQVEK